MAIRGTMRKRRTVPTQAARQSGRWLGWGHRSTRNAWIAWRVARELLAADTLPVPPGLARLVPAAMTVSDVARTLEARVARTTRGLIGLLGLFPGSGIEPGDVVRLDLSLSHEPPAATVRVGEIELLHRAQYHGW